METKTPVIVPEEIAVVKNDISEEEMNFRKTSLKSINDAMVYPPFPKLRIRGKTEIRNEDDIPKLNTTLFIENGKKIWVNAAVVINVARAVIDAQGLQGYEKTNGIYFQENFQQLNEVFGVDFLSLEAFQKLLLGRFCFPINTTDFSFTPTENGLLVQSSKPLRILYENKERLFQQLLEFTPNYALKRLVMSELNSERFFEITYDRYFTFENQTLPQFVKIIIKNKKTTAILLEYNSFDFKDIETPFKIPSNYERKKL